MTNTGAGYTNTNPPIVMIEPEVTTQDELSNIKYDGDFGDIVAIGATSVVGIATTGLTFDLHISNDSVLRDASVVGTAITVSGIQTGYYFTVFDSNTGDGLISYDDAIGITTVGIGTSFIDNIYKVQSVENVIGDSYGIGSTVGAAVAGVKTTLRRVTVSVNSFGGTGS